MNETPTTETDLSDEDVLKRRLLNRIAIAGVMVVGLLGSLAMFDAIYAPSQHVASAPKLATVPPMNEAPPLAEPAASAEAKPAEPVAAPDAAAKPEPATVAKAEPESVPERTASPGAPALQPLPAEKPLTRPATGRPASIRPAEPLPPVASPAARPEPARELALTHPTPQRAPASRPISGTGERQLALQMGVFSNVANAEDLRAKLELNGIPSSIEARVYVGPFRTREEADAARAKLKELGLDGGLLVTMKK